VRKSLQSFALGVISDANASFLPECAGKGRRVSELTALPSFKAPVRATLRSPLALQVERQIAAKNRLMADGLVDLKTAQLALGNPCYSTLRRWIKSGILPVVRFSKRGHYKVRQSVLDELRSKGGLCG
jgi:hypothetical protein